VSVKYPPAAGADDEPVPLGVAGGGASVVVVVDVVVEAVVEVGCGRVVVVVDALVEVLSRGLVATVVVVIRPCLRELAANRRFADATGTEIASTTVTAVITTTIVRSLRLILHPFFDGREFPRRTEALGGRTRARRVGLHLALAGRA
jgi:hypothetical protein